MNAWLSLIGIFHCHVSMATKKCLTKRVVLFDYWLLMSVRMTHCVGIMVGSEGCLASDRISVMVGSIFFFFFFNDGV